MTTSRFLPILNLVGCILVTGVILFQWRKEQDLDKRIRAISEQLATSRGETSEAEKRALVLDGDVAQLKESIAATTAAHRLVEAENLRLATETNEKMLTLATAADEQVTSWQTAIAERDAKLVELGANLSATRKRLNEAIDKLKQAGAR